MVKACSAYNCSNRMVKGGISFHRFPMQNEALLKAWILAVRRKNFVPNYNTYLCATHFTPDDFEHHRTGERTRSRLKSNAVPSIFDFSEGSVTKTRKKELFESSEEGSFVDANNVIMEPALILGEPSGNIIIQTSGVSNSASIETAEELSAEKIDHSYAFGPTPKHKSGDSVEDLKKKMLGLQKQLRKYEKRWENLDMQVTQMKNDNIISEEAWKILSKNFADVRRKVRQKNLERYCKELLVSCGFKKPLQQRKKKPKGKPSVLVVTESANGEAMIQTVQDSADGETVLHMLPQSCNGETVIQERANSQPMIKVEQDKIIEQFESTIVPTNKPVSKPAKKTSRRAKKTKHSEEMLAVQSIEGSIQEIPVTWEEVPTVQQVGEHMQVCNWTGGNEADWTMNEQNIGIILCQMVAQ